jgi:hypothetical protein
VVPPVIRLATAGKQALSWRARESYHSDEPHEWRAPDLDDVDARRAVLPSGG